MILRGRLFEQLRCSGAIFRHAFAFEFGDSQGEIRLAVAGFGCELVPAGGFRRVAPDAQPMRIKLAGEGHRRPIAGIGLDPLHRLCIAVT